MFVDYAQQQRDLIARDDREHYQRTSQAACPICGCEMHGCEVEACMAEHARRGETRRTERAQ